VASLPEVPNKSSNGLTKIQERVSDALAEGHSIGRVARAIAKGDEKKAKLWRRRIRNWTYNDPAFQAAYAAKAKAELQMGIGQTVQAVLKRSSRGRIDAAKLVFEAAGFHNPRVKHEHSGDIKVSLDMPRPGHQEKLNPGSEDVVDAEVVEE
jgi:hypothetical protein